MTLTRAEQITAFLDSYGWGAARSVHLAGDASARQYLRLTTESNRAVLMDADPAKGERVDRFIAVDEWLLSHGHSAPRIFAGDQAAGLLLLEDLGDSLFARLTAADPGREMGLYLAATELVADLQSHAPPDFMATGGTKELAALVQVIPDWYLRGIGTAANQAALQIAPLVATLFDALGGSTSVVSLRDFHAENLLWLPDRQQTARVGLLDFQDAFITDPAYDLVSLFQDARRDVSAETEAACLRHYLERSSRDESAFLPLYALLGAQRALRIIGIFARLAMTSGKTRYLEYMPRVWGYLDRSLNHPTLAQLARAINDGLPRPTAERLERIAASWPQNQKP